MARLEKYEGKTKTCICVTTKGATCSEFISDIVRSTRGKKGILSVGWLRTQKRLDEKSKRGN